jgi:hypothetical protein
MKHRHFLCAMSVLVLGGAPAPAAQFDGAWSVRIVIQEGPCVKPPGYRYPVRIDKGVVKSNSGDSGTIVNGRVDANGMVRASVTRGADRASGMGRLGGDNGSGMWSSSTRHCSGSWTAIREREQ